MESDEAMQLDDSGEVEGKKEGKGRRGVTWDEETIAEHDKLRGTRQKIDEPPTPYHVSFEPADGSDSGEGSRRPSRSNSVSSAPGTPNQKKGEPGYLAEHWHVLTSALEEAARNRDALASRASSTGGGGGMGSPGVSLSRSDSASSAASHSGGGRRRTTSFSSDSEQERQSEERRQQSKEHAQFAKKRLSHYDEYKKLQEWRRRHAEGDDEDEEDEENGEEDGGGKGGQGGEEDAAAATGSEKKKKRSSWLPAFSAGSR